ncbi:MAG: 1-deoxy-D-xylulose-5-phosphate reductoisomerase [Rubripirellula sp.]|nr:1-deoxy-D-xylulose-5-phosphate reductoisomerase [Rubripirellula sp.]
MNPKSSESHLESRDRPQQNVLVLGATGSIGTATVDVLRNLNQVDPARRWCLWGASAHSRVDKLLEIQAEAERWQSQSSPCRLLFSDQDVAKSRVESERSLQNPVNHAGSISVGPESLVQAAQSPEVDTVVAAIVGRAGLESTLAAIESGKRVALANKETLVVAGPVVQEKLNNSPAELLPVDSEHSAIFQCLQDSKNSPRKLILTASGGPFRTCTKQQMAEATRESALAHPTWEMGPKITIDSATMMNKALEIIEARWLFGLPADAIEVMVHPQSIIHSMVEFQDGSVLSQMSPPDMRLPIQYALTYPDRLPCDAPIFDRQKNWNLDLEAADLDRFPALGLGFEVAKVGGTAGAVLNAANEEAVGLFLDGKIRFTDIVDGCADVLRHHNFEPSPPLGRLLQLDGWARGELRKRMNLPS